MQVLTELTAHHAEFLIFCFALLGLIVGELLNVVIYRLPIMLERKWQLAIENAEDSEAEPAYKSALFNLSFPSSHCPACMSKIKPWQNIPVADFLMLKAQMCKLQYLYLLSLPLRRAANRYHQLYRCLAFHAVFCSSISRFNFQLVFNRFDRHRLRHLLIA